MGFEKAPSPIEPENRSMLHEKEHGKLGDNIKFGSHENGSVKKEEKKVSDTNLPKNAVDEWPRAQDPQFLLCQVQAP